MEVNIRNQAELDLYCQYLQDNLKLIITERDNLDKLITQKEEELRQAKAWSIGQQPGYNNVYPAAINGYDEEREITEEIISEKPVKKHLLAPKKTPGKRGKTVVAPEIWGKKLSVHEKLLFVLPKNEVLTEEEITIKINKLDMKKNVNTPVKGLAATLSLYSKDGAPNQTIKKIKNYQGRKSGYSKL